MITPDLTSFPVNIINALAVEMNKIDDDLEVLKRPLRTGDPIQCIGITAALWTPDEESYEFDGGFPGAPTVNTYTIAIQVFNQDMDQERGLATNSTLANLVRRRLSSNMDVRVALTLLENTTNGVTERYKRSGVPTQRFLTNEIEGSFLFMSNLEFFVETEIQ